MSKLRLLIVTVIMLIGASAFGMGLDFGFGTSPAPTETVVEDAVYGNFINPRGVSNYNRDWLVALESGNVSTVIAVNKTDTTYEKPLFQVKGRLTAIHKTWYGYWVGNLDGASSPEGGSVELYGLNGNLRKKLFHVVKYASDIATLGNNIYVVDSGTKEVKVFEYWGFKTSTLKNNFMANPCNIIAFGNTNKGVIYLSDNGGTKVDKFGNKVSIEPSVMKFSIYKGRTKLTNIWFGKNYGFSRPRGIAVKNNILYVVDTLQGNLVGIDMRTNLPVNSIGEFGGKRGQMISPKDMYYDSNLDVFFVVDMFKGSIEAVKEY